MADLKKTDLTVKLLIAVVGFASGVFYSDYEWITLISTIDCQ